MAQRATSPRGAAADEIRAPEREAGSGIGGRVRRVVHSAAAVMAEIGNPEDPAGPVKDAARDRSTSDPSTSERSASDPGAAQAGSSSAPPKQRVAASGAKSRTTSTSRAQAVASAAATTPRAGSTTSVSARTADSPSVSSASSVISRSGAGSSAESVQPARRTRKTSEPSEPSAASEPPSPSGPHPAPWATAVGEQAWTQAQMSELHAELDREAAELRQQLGISADGLAALLRDSGDGAGDDQADAGAKTFEREQEMSVAYNVREMLEQTERALRRMTAGSYGTCESCGQAIGKGRLQVFARATLCRTCKQREERR